jgi:hypothetical protein
MLRVKQNRIRAFRALIGGLLTLTYLEAAQAQEPPITIPGGGPPAAGTLAIPYDRWLVYPSIDFFSQYSNNYFLSPVSKIPGWSFGLTPRVTAEWSNGIHTTTLFGTFTHIQYPTQNEVNTDDGEATLTQTYAPLRDLSFTFLGDYTHQTIAGALTNAIPNPIASTTATVLANGNIVLPNGNIVSPSGQIVGQVGPSFNAGPTSVVNPYDAYTATGSVQKLFGYGVVNLSASILRQDYEKQASATTDFTAKTFREDVAFWLGPVFYAYSDGAFAMNSNTFPTPDSDAYRVIGGVGTRQVGLFRGSIYVGYQGSRFVGAQAAGGIVYGGALAYYPTPVWKISAGADVTLNHAPSAVLPTNQAINLPLPTPIQVPTNGSSQTTTSILHSDYQLSNQWTMGQSIGYTNVMFLGTPSWEDSWFAVASLRYDIWRNLALTWQYQYTGIVSNLPQTSTTRNFISMNASYKF